MSVNSLCNDFNFLLIKFMSNWINYSWINNKYPLDTWITKLVKLSLVFAVGDLI